MSASDHYQAIVIGSGQGARRFARPLPMQACAPLSSNALTLVEHA